MIASLEANVFAIFSINTSIIKSNVLLSSNLDKIVQEESNTTSSLIQVGTALQLSIGTCSPLTMHVQVVKKPYSRVGSDKKRAYNYGGRGEYSKT